MGVPKHSIFKVYLILTLLIYNLKHRALKRYLFITIQCPPLKQYLGDQIIHTFYITEEQTGLEQ